MDPGLERRNANLAADSCQAYIASRLPPPPDSAPPLPALSVQAVNWSHGASKVAVVPAALLGQSVVVAGPSDIVQPPSPPIDALPIHSMPTDAVPAKSSTASSGSAASSTMAPPSLTQTSGDDIHFSAAAASPVVLPSPAPSPDIPIRQRGRGNSAQSTHSSMSLSHEGATSQAVLMASSPRTSLTKSSQNSFVSLHRSVQPSSSGSLSATMDERFDQCLLSYAATLWRQEWADGPDHYGELCKLGTNAMMKRWQKRWFILMNDSLFYFRRRFGTHQQNPLGVLFLDSSTKLEAAPKNAPAHAFGLAVNSACSLESGKAFQSRLYYFSAPSALEKRDWLAALRRATSSLSVGPTVNPKDPPASTTLVQLSRPMMTVPEGPILEEANAPGPVVGSTQKSVASPHPPSHSIAQPSEPAEDGEPIDILVGDSPNAEQNRLPALVARPLEGIQRNVSHTLYSVFLDVYRHINEYRSFVQKASTTQISLGEEAMAATNYLQPATDMIRSVRHLLYFTDGRFTKFIQNTDFIACLGRQMSVIIDRSRKIGYQAKYLTEEECIGFTNDNAVQDLLKQTEELQQEVHSFVTLAKTLSDTDSILSRRDSIIVYCPDMPCFRKGLGQIFDLGRVLAGHINSTNTEDALLDCSELIVCTDWVMKLYVLVAPYRDEARNSMTAVPAALKKFTLSTVEESQLKKSVENIMSGLLDFITALKPSESGSSIYFNDKIFSLFALSLRALITVLFTIWSMRDSTEVTRQLTVAINNLPLQRDRSKLESTPSESIAPVAKAVARALENQRKELSGRLTIETHRQLKPIAESSSTLVSEVPQHSPKCIADPPKASLYALPSPDARTPAFSDGSQYGYSVNQAVARSSFELVSIIIDTATTLSDYVRIMPRRLSSTLIERSVQLAMTIITAASQVEDEMSNMEADNLEKGIIEEIEDAQQSLQRVISAFEVSIRQLTSFFPPSDVSQRVASSSDAVRVTADRLAKAVNRILDLQTTAKSCKTNKEDFRRTFEDRTVSIQSINQDEFDPDNHKKKEENFIDELLDAECMVFNSDSDIVFRNTDGGGGDEMVRGGTVEKLVEKLTYHKMPSTDYTNAFLLTYRSFTTADELLKLLTERYSISTPEGLTEMQRKSYHTKKIVPVRLRVFNFIKMWVKSSFADFKNNPELVEELRRFLQVLKEDFHKGVQDFESVLERKLMGFAGTTQSKHIAQAPPPFLPKSSDFTSVLDFDVLELARQITLVQWDIFEGIQSSECMNQAWNRKQLHHDAPNIRRMIKFSNFLVQWVSTEIVMTENIKSRISVLKHFIMVAEKLKSLNNFDGVKSVICALQNSAVRRLAKTWDPLPTRYKTMFDELCMLMSEEKSSKSYRNFLHSINPPCIPFLGVYLTDLTMIDSGNPDKLKESPNLINFYKHYLEAQVIQEIRRYQCTPYSLTRVSVITEWIQNRQALEVQDTYNQSLQIEPRIQPVVQNTESNGGLNSSGSTGPRLSIVRRTSVSHSTSGD